MARDPEQHLPSAIFERFILPYLLDTSYVKLKPSHEKKPLNSQIGLRYDLYYTPFLVSRAWNRCAERVFRKNGLVVLSFWHSGYNDYFDILPNLGIFEHEIRSSSYIAQIKFINGPKLTNMARFHMVIPVNILPAVLATKTFGFGTAWECFEVQPIATKITVEISPNIESRHERKIMKAMQDFQPYWDKNTHIVFRNSRFDISGKPGLDTRDLNTHWYCIRQAILCFQIIMHICSKGGELKILGIKALFLLRLRLWPFVRGLFWQVEHNNFSERPIPITMTLYCAVNTVLIAAYFSGHTIPDDGNYHMLCSQHGIRSTFGFQFPRVDLCTPFWAYFYYTHIMLHCYYTGCPCSMRLPANSSNLSDILKTVGKNCQLKNQITSDINYLADTKADTTEPHIGKPLLLINMNNREIYPESLHSESSLYDFEFLALLSNSSEFCARELS
ncbi:hypothetical protein M433DRAFT_138526 [Acidomyces richmondensis BFW]|nr:hypothetical protein M433DRAFT_138526 [Acidomyces richmondensis BFW]